MTGPISGNSRPAMPDQVAGTTAEQIADLQKMASGPIPTTQHTPPAAGNGDVASPKPPPLLDEPVAFSADDLADQLRHIGTKNQETQQQGIKAAILSNKIKLEENQQARVDKIHEAQNAANEAKNAAEKKFWWGLAGSILAVAGSTIALGVSIAAAVLTGGGLSAAIVFSSVALVASVTALASVINSKTELIKDKDGKAVSFELSNLMTMAASAILEKCGVDKKDANSIGKLATGAAAIALSCGTVLFLDPAFLSNVVAGGMELGKVDPNVIAIVTAVVTTATALTYGLAASIMSGGGSAGSQVPAKLNVLFDVLKTAEKSSLILKGTLQVIGGGTQIGASVEGIKATIATRDADMAAVDKKNIETAIVGILATMEEETEDMKKILKEIEDTVQGISSIIAGNAQSHSVIAANLKGHATV